MRAFNEYCSEKFKKAFSAYAVSVRSERTLGEYVSIVNMITSFLGKDFLKITEPDALRYFEYLQGEVERGNISSGTYNLRTSCMKTIAKFVQEEGLGFENPFVRVKRYEADDSIKERFIPTIDELDKIIESASGDPMWFLILCLALRACLTATQITRIRRHNIFVESDGRVILFYPKTSTQPKDLWITLPKDVRGLMLSYLETEKGDEEGHIFFNEWRNPLSIRNVDKGVKKFVAASGVPHHYSLKDLRSRGVLEMASADIDPEEIGEYAGLSQMRVRSFLEKKHLINRECPQDRALFQLKHFEKVV